MSHSKVRAKRKILTGKDITISIAIAFSICTLPSVFMVWCWSVTKFPPQIFGNNEDHFRGHIISPIPESVEILDVYFDDIIIHPDVSYYFRFSVNREDLNKIISYRKLKTNATDCSFSSNEPEWWDVSSLDNVESYRYDSLDGTIINLCYHASSEVAYYLFFTY
jgi:hypothetical protein